VNGHNPEKARKRTGRRVNAVDVCIIIIAALAIAGAGLRLYTVKYGSLPGGAPKLENYAVSFLVSDIRETSADCFKPGTMFYVEQSSDVFGSLMDNVAVTPAELYIENERGEYILSYAVDDEDTGDDGRVDVRGTVLASGIMTDTGFLLDGNTYIAPNKTISIQSTEIVVNVLVTDISKID
jgi:hypothetical protein